MESNTGFIGEHERPWEDALAGPFRGLDEEMLLGSLDIYQIDWGRGILTSERWTTFEAGKRRGSNLVPSFRAKLLRLAVEEWSMA